MGRKKLADNELLRFDIKTRVSQQDFDKLQAMLAQSRYQSMSELLRDIICKKRVTVYTKDASLDHVMGELAQARKELNAIGNNINQVTRHLNGMLESSHKPLLVIEAAALFEKVGERVDLLYPLISQLAKKWLQ